MSVHLRLYMYLSNIILFSPKTVEQYLTDVFNREIRFLPYTLIFCFLLLFLFLRKFSFTFVAGIPVLSAIVCVLLFFWIKDKPVTLASLSAFPLVIGLALDHGIMVVHSSVRGIQFSVTRAMFVSSATACMGMGLLAFAKHPALADMGIVLLIGLIIELASAIILLPHLFSSKNRSVP